MDDIGEVIAYGRTAELFAYGNDHVLKLFRKGIPSQIINEEFRISSIVYHSGMPIPEPDKIMEVNDRTGIVYQRVTGDTMLKIISKKLWFINKESIRMARLHTEIHRQNVSDLPDQKSILKFQIEQAPILTTEEKERVINDLVNLQEDTKLCHGDFHPDNIIVGNTEWIIDWMTGVQGNPAGDVARTVLLLKYGTMPDETPKVLVWLIGRVRKQILNTYISHYIKSSNMKYEEIDNWLVPIAAARLNEWIPEREKQVLVHLIRQKLSSEWYNN